MVSRAASCVALAASCAALSSRRAPPRRNAPRRAGNYLDDRYSSWSVDVEAYEALEEPLVYVDQSAGAGLGVFAKNRIAAGTTITEYVGLVAPTPDARCDELELQQRYYGPDWRKYSQRYEIGLTGTAVADAGGAAKGGAFGEGAVGAAEYCDVDESPAACRARAGEADFVLLGKVPAQGACPEEGVAQLVNDHTAVRAPRATPDAPLASAALRGDGTIRPDDVDGLVFGSRSGVPLAADVDRIERVVRAYVARIEARNNVALCQAQSCDDDGCVSVPRVFAVATRPIPAGAELRYTYGVEWWLAQLRRAALAQLVTCRPAAARAAALASVIRAIEQVSVDAVAEQARAVGRAGSMPRAFVTPLEPLPPLDDLLAPDGENWRRAILQEEFASATECPVEDLYEGAFDD